MNAIRRPVTTRRLLAVIAGVCVAIGCASTAAVPGRADIGALEARLRQDSTSSTVRVRLAVAWRDSGQVARAVSLLEPVAQSHPDDPAAALWLAIAYEDQSRYADARRQYRSFLDNAGATPLRRRVEARMELLGRLELREAVRQSLARESELSAAAPTPRTVGVFPFQFAGSDSSLRPLGHAMAELLTIDLSETSRLRVLERSQVQVLLDEIELSRSRYVDPTAAVRAGRMLSAEHIVQGRVAGGQSDLDIQALVVMTAGARDTTSAPLSGRGVLARVFDIEKQLAFGVYSRLGIQLTVAERQRIDRRATSNVQALLAFGFGLEAQDAGEYAEAARHFTRAVQLDPRFERAGQLRAETERLSQAGANTRELATLAASRIDLTLDVWQRRLLAPDALQSSIPDPELRNPVVEILGTEGLGRGTGIDIIIRRPTGGL